MTRRIRKRLNLAMIEKAAAIEDDFFNFFTFRALSHELPYFFGGCGVSPYILCLKDGLRRLSRSECETYLIVDDLRIDMPPGKMYGKPGTLGRANYFLTNTLVTHPGSIKRLRHKLLNGFALLADDVLPNIPDSLAFIRLCRVKSADIGRGLSDDLLVDALNLDLVCSLHGNLHAIWD